MAQPTYVLLDSPASSSPAGQGYQPDQIRTAYGINAVAPFAGQTADGGGQTIAIVDAYNDPTILTDLDGFDQAVYLTANQSQTLYQQYGAASSFLTVYNESGVNITSSIANSGHGGVPRVDRTGGWELEESLDVEWAHAIAPGAKIDLIEASNDGNGIYTAVATAASLPGVSVVSMSWGIPSPAMKRRWTAPSRRRAAIRA